MAVKTERKGHTEVTTKCSQRRHLIQSIHAGNTVWKPQKARASEITEAEEVNPVFRASFPPIMPLRSANFMQKRTKKGRQPTLNHNPMTVAC